MKFKIAPALLLIGLTPLLAQRYTASPDVPATAANAGYPLHVRILQAHWNHINGGYQGYGHGVELDEIRDFRSRPHDDVALPAERTLPI